MASKLTCDINADLQEIIYQNNWDKLFVLVDENTRNFCLPVILASEKLKSSQIIIIPSGEEHKTLETLAVIWQSLSEHNATRYSCLINLGGGMVTDIGGFAASTFKRGMDFINIPTSLLGIVDAATGGKTGINFLGLKNEIGSFSSPKEVLINVDFLKTQDEKNFLSGFAEMIKHALIHSREDWNEILRFDLENIDYENLGVLIEKNLQIKEDIVKQDSQEKGIRKALNFGHTIGHALESFSYESGAPLLHGYAVIYGLLGELYLSRIRYGFPKEDIYRLKEIIAEYYGMFRFSCKQYDALYNLMKHDKKNRTQEVNFTLLSDIGKVYINQTATQEEIFECFDFLREG